MTSRRERSAIARVLWGMRRAAILLVLSGCFGGLQNAPLEQSGLHGRLVGDGSSGAQLFILGAPEVQTIAGPDGDFTLDHVPAGQVRLVVSTARTAARVDVTATPGQRVELGQLAMQAAGSIVVRVRRHGTAEPGVVVQVAGTPLSATSDGDGMARLGALPADCYTVHVQGDADVQACLGSSDLQIEAGEDSSHGGAADGGGSEDGGDSGSGDDGGA